MIFSKENFEGSVNRLLSKPNNCGADGILISEFADYWKLNEEKILSLLREGKYKPSVVLLEEMIFKKGKKRLISKYTCTDRIIQDVLKNKVMTVYKEKFSKYSFAYIPDRGVQKAVRYAAALIDSGKKFVAEIDVKDFLKILICKGWSIFCRKKSAMKQKKGLFTTICIHGSLLTEEKKEKHWGLCRGVP